MATNYSATERALAALLSATPGLKRGVKQAYAVLNSVIYRKGYKHKILDKRVGDMRTYNLSDDTETFGGYYDRPSANSRGQVAMCATHRPTSGKPSADCYVEIVVCDADGGNMQIVDKTRSYTWQQGARVQWLDDDTLLYNVFEGGSYQAVMYSLAEGKRVRTFCRPNQDACGRDFFLSIDYRRVIALRPDYGYRNLPMMTDEELQATDGDGIWRVDAQTGEACLLHSLADVMGVAPKAVFKDALHKVNHLMISPDGKGFIFIHRWYRGGRRSDRLMYSDFSTMRVLADDNMVSHMCWLDNDNVFGYLRLDGVNGFYTINIASGRAELCAELTGLKTGDGHPTVSGDWIVVDTYPDKSRMQTLYLYNRKTHLVKPLAELYQSVKYVGESRCDLHPRFSRDGTRLFFDSVYGGSRRLCSIDLCLDAGNANK